MTVPSAHDVAVQAMYLMIGAEHGMKPYAVTQRLTDDDSPHPAMADGGHIGLADALAHHAATIALFLADLPTDMPFLGVFEYEVTEGLGTWHVNNVDASPEEFSAELERQAESFFAQ